ncbi:MAG: thermonuclease family protein [Patescibacteria group bacterium]
MAKQKTVSFWKMRWPLILLFCSLLGNILLGIPFFQKYFSFAKSTQKMTVANIVDGDTFDTNDGTRVRLLGLDAPEYPKACLSKRAKDRLGELILGKEVVLDGNEKDRFGRRLSWVTVDQDVPVSIVLAEEGLGVVDQINDEHGALLAAAQKSAQGATRGIWSQECTNKQTGCVIKGNYHKGTKERVYHLPDCYNYNQININPNESDRWFCTEDEAKAVGFTKSLDCPGEK